MDQFPPTLILRHRKENLKKCSLSGLESRKDLCFFTYPWIVAIPDLSPYIVLTLDAPPLTEQDREYGLFIIDGTWRYAKKMAQSLPKGVMYRSLPSLVATAYPRCQNDCPNPEQGLASVEALYLAYETLGRDPAGLLDHYYWKNKFLKNLSAI